MNISIIKEVITSRKRTLILIAVLLVLDVGLSAFVALYQKPLLANKQVNWFDKRRSASGGTAVAMAAVYAQGEKDLQTWQGRIIPKKDFARFVGSLYEIAAKNSLAFKGVAFKASQVKGEDLALYEVDMNVVGKYGAIKSFIADLGRRREIMTLDNLSLTSSVENGDAIALKVQMSVYLRMEGQ